MSESLEQTCARLEASVAEYKALLPNLRGGRGDFIVYTGMRDCPIFVKFNDDWTGVCPNIGILNATRIYAESTARNMAGMVRNGFGEVGKYMTEREALEVSIKGAENVIELIRSKIPA